MHCGSLGAAFLLLLMLVATGCAGTGGAARGERGAVDEPEVEEEGDIIVHADYERFDARPYSEEDFGPAVLEHAVPDELMDGVAYVGGTRTLDGYRIQLFQTQDPSQAEAVVDEATDWWYNQKQAGASSTLFGRESAPVYNVWRQPYYRIRIGDFASRDAAEAALQELQVRFNGAFVVPDRVTISN